MNEDNLKHNLINQDQDPLQYVPVEKWAELQEAFKSDWLRSISGYTILETQRKWIEHGFKYGFKVFCPFGDVWNGMVAVNEKNNFYEIVILCPRDDTNKLEEALRTTKVIDWRKKITIPFVPRHVIDCVKKVVEDVNVDIELILESESFIVDKQIQLFEDIWLPSNITFELLLPEHAELVDSKWPHRYPDSIWYIQLLINAKSGYGLFKNGTLISWCFINEAGNLGHMYTLEEHRKNGYAEALLKLICKKVLSKDGKEGVAVYCVKDNLSARNLYEKVGFKRNDCGTSWCYLKPK